MKKTLLSTAIAAMLPIGGASAMTAGAYVGGSYRPQRSAATIDLAALDRAQAKQSVDKVKDIDLGKVNADSLELTALNPVSELMVLDASIPDKHLFYSQLKPGQQIVEIDVDADGLKQLTHVLDDYQRLDALHIISHAEPGSVQLGNTHIDAEMLKQEIGFFTAINNTLKPDADILFYGCDLAKGQKGEAFLDIVQANTHVDIAASNDLTGNADKGGDWDLEIQRGVIDTEQPFSEIALKDFSTVLASYTPPDFCTHGVPANYCGGNATETSSDTNMVISGDGTEIRRIPVGNVIYTYKASGNTASTTTITGQNTYSSFNLTALTATIYGGTTCTSLSVTNNSGATIGTPIASAGTGDHVINVSSNSTGISSFTINATGCGNSNGVGLKSFTAVPSDTTAPTFNSAGSTPNDNATNVSITNDIVMDFSENIAAGTGNVTLKVAGGSNVQVFNIATATATTTPGAGAIGISGDKLYINPTSSLSGETSYAVRIDGTAIDDAAGNSFAGITDDTTFNFTTADVTAPTFNSAGSTPNDNATNVSITNDIVMDFSENIAAGTGNVTLKVAGGSNVQVFDITSATATTTPGAGAIGISGDKLYINPTSNLTGETSYAVRIDGTAIDDAAGNSFAGITDDTTFNFTTADVTAPTFNSAGSTPNDNATNVSITNDLVMDFSENIAAGTGNVTLKVAGGSNVQVFDITSATATTTPGAGAIGISGDKLYINPTSNLTGETSYAVRIDGTAIDDAAGNSFAGITDDTTFNFTTADVTAPTFNSAGSTPNDNGTNVSVSNDIVMDFSENIAAGTGNVTLKVAGGSNVQVFDITSATATTTPGAGALGISGDKLYINPTSDLSNGVSYAIRVDGTAIDDAAGNSFAGITDDTSFNFTTEFALPTITSATYNGATGNLVVTGTGFIANAGAVNDVDVSMLTITGQGGGTRALSVSSDVEITSATEFTVAVTGADKTAVDALINNNGTSSTDATTYNLAAADDFIAALTSGNSADLTGNAITASNADSTPPVVQSIAVVGSPAASAASVTFRVTFDEQSNFMTLDDFELTTTGTASGTLASIVGNPDTTLPINNSTSVDVTVNSISGTGTLRLDLKASTDIVDSSANNNGNGTNGFVAAFNSGTAHSADRDAPTVSSVSVPANATYIQSQNLDFTVNTNENVTVNTTGGTPQIAVTIGSTVRQATYQSGSGSQALVFRYTVQNNELDADGVAVGALAANGGTLRDAAGNDMTLTLNSVGSTANVRVDSVAPTVTSVSVPANDTYTATENMNFTVNFSEPITVGGTGGTGELLISVGTAPARAAILVGGSGTNALTFRHTVINGDVDTDGITVNSISLPATATYRDAAGNDAVLTLNNIGNTTNVRVDAAVPTVTSVSVPANASYRAGQNLDFTVNTSENVNVVTTGGTPQILVTIGSTLRNATYQSGSGTQALLFRYTVQNNELDTNGITVGTLSANGGTLRDAAGNNMTLTLNSVGSTTSVLVDAVVPTVSSVSVPANNTYASGANLDFTVNTSENVTVNTTGGTPQIAVTIGSTVRQATYQSGSGTSALLFRYTVQTGEVDTDGIAVGALSANGGTLRDTAGNDMTLTLNSVGSTTAVLVDATGPTLAITMSDNNLVDGETATVTFTFSETPTGFIAGDIAAPNGSISAFAVNGSDDKIYTATFTPTGGLSDATNMISVLGTSYTDGAGNPGANANSPNYAIVDTSVDALNKVQAAATGNDASAVTVADLNAINGVSGAIAANLSAYQAAIAAAAAADVDTAGEIQTIITSINALEEVKAAASASDASGVTVAELNSITGVSSAIGANQAAYQAAIAASASADVDTAAEIEALIVSVNVVEEVKAAATANDASGVTFTELNTILNANNAAITGNEAAYRTAIAALTSADVDTAAKIIALVKQVNSLEVLKAYADNNTNPAPTVQTYTDLGIAGINTNNLTDANNAVDGVASGDVDTVAKVNTLLSAVILDSDGDGVGDSIDLDDDNDGMTDVVENTASQKSTASGKSQISNTTDIDTDGDGVPDRLDVDSDNDGLPDSIEFAGEDADKDGDGRVDNFTDGNGDGLNDTSSANTPPDTDGDGEQDFRDTDSDGDGKSDLLETAGAILNATLDANGDGRIDTDTTTDADNDGMRDKVDPAVSGGTAGSKLSPLDTDGDGTADQLDTDADNDGTPDNVDVRVSTTPDVITSSRGVAAMSSPLMALGMLAMLLLRARRKLWAIALLLLSGSAFSADDASNWEVQVGLGHTHFDTELGAPLSLAEDVEPLYSLGLGYRVHDYIVTQVRYTDLGTADINPSSQNAEIDYKAVSLNVQGELPVNEAGNFKVYGLVGYASVERDTQNLTVAEKNTDEAHLGLGVKFYQDELNFGLEVGSYAEDVGYWSFNVGLNL